MTRQAGSDDKVNEAARFKPGESREQQIGAKQVDEVFVQTKKGGA